ncbi:MAG: mechanosensitive ion channel [Lachnospiraceae bacterium]|nr:mechanosensitive ion channel [Lachnospiraceae bacterium]
MLLTTEVVAFEEIDLTVVERFFRDLPERALNLGIRVVLALVFFIVGMQCIKLLRKIIRKSLERANADVGVTQFLDSFIKIGTYAILTMLIATSFGVDATSIIAVFGSAGVAIGLALQGSLSNLAGGVLILILKPFKVGDYIIEDTNKNEGTVTEVQIFYTKLTTPDNKTIILPNGTLANSSLTNVTHAPYRRNEIKIGISYESDIKTAKKVLQDILDNDESVLQDKDKDVFVDDLADSSVVIGVRCWFLNDDYWRGRWRLIEEAKYKLEENGIVIAYPQLDVHIQQTDVK